MAQSKIELGERVASKEGDYLLVPISILGGRIIAHVNKISNKKAKVLVFRDVIVVASFGKLFEL